MTRPILVTGASGRLARALWRVTEDPDLLVGWAGRADGQGFAAVDVTDAEAVRRALGELRPRVIIHLASLIGPACETDPDRAERVNVEGTANVLAGALESGAEKIVFASTAAVYGTRRRHPLAESDPVEPVGVYAETKLRAETLLAAAPDTVAVDVLRVFNVYGPGMTGSLVNRLAQSTEAAPVRLAGLDGFVRDYVHVDDVARSLLMSSASIAPEYRVLNVGSGVPRSNRDLWESLPDGVRSTIEIGPDIDSFSCADISAIRRHLSWAPRAEWSPFGGGGY